MAKPVKLDLLAIAAHPDDIEITCAGLLIKMAESGRKTGGLDLTRGEMGTQGTIEQRQQEAERAAEIMGLSFRGQLGLPDSDIKNDKASRLKLAQVIRDTSPEIVILPHWEQRHPDHRVCSQLGFDACFMAGLKKAELSGEPHRPEKILYASYFRNSMNSFIVDISEQFGRKLQAIAAYQSQFGDTKADLKRFSGIIDGAEVEPELSESSDRNSIFHPGVNIFEYLYVRSRNLGLGGNVSFAEGYTVKETVSLEDPFDLLNRSI